MNKFILILFLSATFATTYAQEILTGLSNNPVLINQQLENTNHKVSKGANEEIHLPMLEDFSRPSLFPNPKYWASKSVFVNNSYAINPPSVGVVTFDAMDEKGIVYSHMSTFPAGADTFTTNNIRLDSAFGTFQRKLHPKDSVYLSFFVQPQGNGSIPLSGDSLVLQFYDDNNSKWNSVWNIDGMPLDTFRAKYDTSFLRVMIPVVKPEYFSSKFKFRFYNYARVPSSDKPSWKSGLHSNWNIDYIILDTNRRITDTFYADNAIQNASTTLLKEYQSMSWKQYNAAPASSMKVGQGVSFFNHDNLVKNVAQRLYIYDLWDKSLSFSTPTTSVNLSSKQSSIYSPDYNAYTFTTLAPKYPDYKILYHISSNTGNPDIFKNNDTAYFYQRFYNYLSYDDGIPEAGYGLSTPNGKLAYQFNLNTDDTLQSIQMYFNQTLGNANQKYFYLTVWDDNNGTPGNIIYEKSGKRPEFDNQLFKFYTYVLDQELAVSGTIYIGWRQTTKDNLNVGFDKNNDHSDKVFYNVSGNWYNSSFKGAPMIRPILGQEQNAHVGIKKPSNTKEVDFSIYPNPNNTKILNIKINDSFISNSNFQLSIFSIQGQQVYLGEFENRINLSYLSKGVYIVKIINLKTNRNSIKKLIIN
ncbi:MAG: T9SS type A sorting domain-containing protein [Bacteroidales bacterium]|nr:T9SS type A sorting domain-containing protein [Bacteroidales bacterium]